MQNMIPRLQLSIPDFRPIRIPAGSVHIRTGLLCITVRSTRSRAMRIRCWRGRKQCVHRGSQADDLTKVLPVVNTNGSDSAMLDNTLEFLVMSGMELPLAVMITIPEPWTHNRYDFPGGTRFLSVLCDDDGALGWSCFHPVFGR